MRAAKFLLVLLLALSIILVLQAFSQTASAACGPGSNCDKCTYECAVGEGCPWLGAGYTCVQSSCVCCEEGGYPFNAGRSYCVPPSGCSKTSDVEDCVSEQDDDCDTLTNCLDTDCTGGTAQKSADAITWTAPASITGNASSERNFNDSGLFHTVSFAPAVGTTYVSKYKRTIDSGPGVCPAGTAPENQSLLGTIFFADPGDGETPDLKELTEFFAVFVQGSPTHLVEESQKKCMINPPATVSNYTDVSSTWKWQETGYTDPNCVDTECLSIPGAGWIPGAPETEQQCCGDKPGEPYFEDTPYGLTEEAASPTSCFDGMDNDCDWLFDCNDPDCLGGEKTLADSLTWAAPANVSGQAKNYEVPTWDQGEIVFTPIAGHTFHREEMDEAFSCPVPVAEGGGQGCKHRGIARIMDETTSTQAGPSNIGSWSNCNKDEPPPCIGAYDWTAFNSNWKWTVGGSEKCANNLPPETTGNGPFSGCKDAAIHGISGDATDDESIVSLQWSVSSAFCTLYDDQIPNPQGLNTTHATNLSYVVCTEANVVPFDLTLSAQDNEGAVDATPYATQLTITDCAALPTNSPPIVVVDDASGLVGQPISVIGTAYDEEGVIDSVSWQIVSGADCTKLNQYDFGLGQDVVTSVYEISCSDGAASSRQIKMTATDDGKNNDGSSGTPASGSDSGFVSVSCPASYRWDPIAGECVFDVTQLFDAPPQVIFGGVYYAKVSPDDAEMQGTAFDDKAIASMVWSINDSSCNVQAPTESGIGTEIASSETKISCPTTGFRIVTLTAYDNAVPVVQSASATAVLLVVGGARNKGPSLNYVPFTGIVLQNISLIGSAEDSDGTISSIAWYNVEEDCKVYNNSSKDIGGGPPGSNKEATALINCSTATPKITVLSAEDDSGNEVFGFAPVNVKCPDGKTWDAFKETCVEVFDVFEIIDIRTKKTDAAGEASNVFAQDEKIYVEVDIKNVSSDVIDAEAVAHLQMLLGDTDVFPAPFYHKLCVVPANCNAGNNSDNILNPGETKTFIDATTGTIDLTGYDVGSYTLLASVDAYPVETQLGNNFKSKMVSVIESSVQINVAEFTPWLVIVTALIVLVVIYLKRK